MLTLPIQFEDLLKGIDQLTDEQKQIVLERLAEKRESSVEDRPKKPRVLDMHPGAFQTNESSASANSKPRTPNLGAGMVWMSDDFDDPLPDEFWLGEDA